MIGGIAMKIKMFVILPALMLALSTVAVGKAPKVEKLVAGGTETNISGWVPGQGAIEPGGKLRGWEATFEEALIGPAGELASGVGPVTMSCNLNETLTGPCWGTFEYSNSIGRWIGFWHGTFNFETGAGSCKAVGYGRGGLKGMILKNDSVYAGWAVGGVTGYVYSTVTITNRAVR
jgi:hypothetical protein